MARMDPKEFLDGTVLPALFERLDQVFREFDWRKRGGKWETGPNLNADAIGYFVGRPGRAFCKEKSKHQWAVAGGESCTWTRYVLGMATEPKGQDWIRAIVRLAERVGGIDTSPITRDPVSDEERARWARQAEERREEAMRHRAEAERREQREEAMRSGEAARLIAEAAALVRDGEEQTPLHRYLKRRGRDVRRMPGGQWPSGAIFAPTMVRRRPVPTIIVPGIREGKIVAAHRIFIDRLGQTQAVDLYGDGETVRKATLGVARGAHGQIGRGFPDRVLVLTEGWEDGMAIHQATGWTVWPCFSTSGLLHVTLTEAERAQIDTVIVAGDLDSEKRPKTGRPFRPGQETARTCADRLRREYQIKVAVALPAHAFAPDLVTPDELPRTGKSVDWENIANTLGDAVVQVRMGRSRAAADVREQGRLPWEPEAPADSGPGPAGEESRGVADAREDRRAARRCKDGVGFEKWHFGAERWVRWDPDFDVWIEPIGPVLPANHLDAAREYLMARHLPAKIGRRGGGLTILATGGRPYRHNGVRWVEYSEDPAVVVRGDVCRYFAGHCKRKNGRGREPAHWVLANISKTEVDTIAARAIDEVRTLTPFDDFQSQFWLRPNLRQAGDRLEFVADDAWSRRIDRPAEEGLPPPESVIPLRNGLFDLAAWRRDQTLTLIPHTPLFFNTGVVEAELPYAEAQAALREGGLDRLTEFARSLCPEWIAFLEGVFRHTDPKAAPLTIRELHKVIGNFLTTDMTHHQANMVWLVGPPGAGKSVMQGVIEALLGPSNCVPSTITQLESQFHLRSWIGKRLALFPDMDVSGRVDKKSVVEKIKMLSTGDPMTVDRKHLDEITAWRNRARMLIAANQMPSLPDPSGSIDRRSMCFEFRHPVKKSEMDPHLLETLTSPRSLAGVLLLALIGLIDLAEEGFVQPVWHAGPLEDLKDQGSLYPAFIAECLEIVRPEHEGYEQAWVANRDITLAYGRFAEAEGSTYRPRAATVISELKAPLIQAGWVSVARAERNKMKGVLGVKLTPKGHELVSQQDGAGASGGGSGGYETHSFLP